MEHGVWYSPLTTCSFSPCLINFLTVPTKINTSNCRYWYFPVSALTDVWTEATLQGCWVKAAASVTLWESIDALACTHTHTQTHTHMHNTLNSHTHALILNRSGSARGQPSCWERWGERDGEQERRSQNRTEEEWLYSNLNSHWHGRLIT